MKSYLLFFLLTSSSLSAFAQSASTHLTSSSALLITQRGDTLRGTATVDLAQSKVQIYADQGFRVLNFRDVYTLRLYDEMTHRMITYQQYSDRVYRQRPRLLEQVVVGSVHFLKKSQPRVYDSYFNTIRIANAQSVVESDYFLWHNGKLQRVKNFKKQLRALCETPQHYDQMTTFAKQGQLKFYRPEDQARLIHHLNSLTKLAYSKE
ncbi:MAG: hypothetical protein AAF944_19015 [Bacteroidota bacterium]